MKELTNWKQTSWLVTRKLVYYAVVAIVFLILGTFTGILMSVADTFTFLVGILLGVVAVAGLFTVVIREISFYIRYVNER